jgi:hypothetical protein
MAAIRCSLSRSKELIPPRARHEKGPAVTSPTGHPVSDQEHAAGRRVCLLRVDLNLGSRAALGPPRDRG